MLIYVPVFALSVFWFFVWEEIFSSHGEDAVEALVALIARFTPVVETPVVETTPAPAVEALVAEAAPLVSVRVVWEPKPEEPAWLLGLRFLVFKEVSSETSEETLSDAIPLPAPLWQWEEPAWKGFFEKIN